MTPDTTDWTELREFKDVALTRSFVLSWHVEGGDLVLDLDLCLEPSHPFYEQPRRSQGDCIRPALLKFPACKRLVTGVRDAHEAVDTVASRIGHGRIAGLERSGEGRYKLRGDFGTVTIDGDRPLLRLGNGPA